MVRFLISRRCIHRHRRRSTHLAWVASRSASNRVSDLTPRYVASLVGPLSATVAIIKDMRTDKELARTPPMDTKLGSYVDIYRAAVIAACYMESSLAVRALEVSKDRRALRRLAARKLKEALKTLVE